MTLQRADSGVATPEITYVKASAVVYQQLDDLTASLVRGAMQRRPAMEIQRRVTKKSARTLSASFLAPAGKFLAAWRAHARALTDFRVI